MKRPFVRMNAVVVAGLLGVTVCGCAKNGKTGAPPADEQTIRSVRQTFMAADPKALVGVVITVIDGGEYAAVSDIPVQEFKEGDALTIVDSNRQPIGNGIVKAITSDALHIQVVENLVEGRKVQKGDLAVRFRP